MTSSLHVVISMNFNRPQTHLHYLRELIFIFQTLNREPFRVTGQCVARTIRRDCVNQLQCILDYWMRPELQQL